MIERNALLERTGLTPRQLTRLRSFRLIPAPTWRPVPGRGGGTSEYPDSVLDRIAYIKLLQAEGLSLADIADRLRGTIVIPATHEPGPGTARVRLPVNPHRDATIERLWAQTAGRLDGQELVGLTVRVITENGQRMAYVAGALVR